MKSHRESLNFLLGESEPFTSGMSLSTNPMQTALLQLATWDFTLNDEFHRVAYL